MSTEPAGVRDPRESEPEAARWLRDKIIQQRENLFLCIVHVGKDGRPLPGQGESILHERQLMVDHLWDLWRAYLPCRCPPPRPTLSVSVTAHDALDILQRCLDGTGLLVEGDGSADAAHSPDFASVRWFGTVYMFTGSQRRIIRELWSAWKNRTPEVSSAYLFDAAGVDDSTTARIPSLFRFKGQPHAAWGTMIVPGSCKDTYRLREPEQPSGAKKKSDSTENQR
jgi:hypothetical protein